MENLAMIKIWLLVLLGILLAVLLFFARKRNWIKKDSFLLLGEIATIIAIYYAVLSLVVSIPNENTKKIPEFIITPTIAQRILYSDDFSNPDSGWGTTENYRFFYGYKDGRFYIDFGGSADEVFSAWIEAGKFDDVGIQVKLLGPLDYVYDRGIRGIGFGSSEGDKEGIYIFSINRNGECQLSQYKESEYADINTLFTGTVPQFDPLSSFHTLRVESKYREVSGYVDDNVCVSALLPEYKSGYVGLFATASYGESSVYGETYFDDFIIYKFP